ncbi:uncharacterized protein LOC130899848 [Diorhabda carinulata]|uniref:uncharacterized protein LOC130899848 n=1 Tax=Diorhabda carinulata TaxID=1163345 RepID=UPI0025A1E749|nr:uncharacterized protein LOC130899848 [Diorhabda carinulata]
MKPTIVLMLLLLYKTIKTEDITVTNVNNLLLPINLGTSNLIYTKHTFIYYIDLEFIHKQINNLKQYYYNLRNNLSQANATNPISYHNLAEQSLSRTEILINTLDKKSENIYPHLRLKRGLINNAVGKIDKWLFGTLDSDDEERYNNAINVLQQNQKQIIHEVNLQISLHKKLIDHYNKSITTLWDNQWKLFDNIEKFHISIENKIITLNYFITFQSTIAQINLDCQSLITLIDNIENAITFSKLNTIHSSVISSQEILEMIKYLSTIYNKEQIPKFNNILTYYLFLGSQVTFSKSKIIFATHVPILKPKTYEFFHLYPVIQNHTIFIPPQPYLSEVKKKLLSSKKNAPN